MVQQCIAFSAFQAITRVRQCFLEKKLFKTCNVIYNSIKKRVTGMDCLYFTGNVT